MAASKKSKRRRKPVALTRKRAAKPSIASSKAAPSNKAKPARAAHRAVPTRKPAANNQTVERSATQSKSDASVDAKLFPVADATVRDRTGKSWDEWLALLDRAGVAARKFDHHNFDHNRAWQAVMKFLPGSDGWWAQMVSVGYERVRGLRAMNQSCNGDFQASVSRTLVGSLEKVYSAWEENCARWLDAPGLTFTKFNRGKNIRARWPDGTLIDIRFTGKGPDKCQVVADTTKLDGAQAVAAAKAFWQQQFARLEQFLGS
jgi:hypothetical protein